LLQRSPSLVNELDADVQHAWRLARRQAGAEMHWSKDEWKRRLPDQCSWSIKELRDSDFLPE
jgi:hypothetical protein